MRILFQNGTIYDGTGNAPAVGDRVLILSTCLTADNKQRFLVMAKLLP